MKTFIDGRMMVGVSCALILLGANGINADANTLEMAQRSNLRRSLASRQQLGEIRLADTKNHRSLDEADAETEELESIEKEFSGETSSVVESETEELEKIEEEFDGGKKDEDGASEEKETAEETETAEAETPEVEPTFKDEATEEKETDVPTDFPTDAPTADPAKTKGPTMKPTLKPYEKDDGFDPIKAEDEKLAEEEEVQELEKELKKEETVARQAGGLGIFFGILAMIFTAHQMSENPDGIYASVCRLAITISSVVVKIICMPCRKVLGIGSGGNPYSGHMPISTSDYSYRNDPYSSNANAGFEMS